MLATASLSLLQRKTRRASTNSRQYPADANGVKQVAFVGVTNPLDPEIETADEVAADLIEASKYIAKD